MKNRLFRFLTVLLVCAALLSGFAACSQPGQPIEATPQPEVSEQPAAEEPPVAEPEVPAEDPAEEPPLGFPIPDWMAQENAALDQGYQYLMDNPEEVLALLNGRLLAFREGTFEEMSNHHAPWPEDFPSPQEVTYPLTNSDYVVWVSHYEPIDETTSLDGELAIWVRLDNENHYMVLEPAWFGSAGTDQTTLGFSNSRFAYEEPFFGFDAVWNSQNS